METARIPICQRIAAFLPVLYFEDGEFWMWILDVALAGTTVYFFSLQMTVFYSRFTRDYSPDLKFLLVIA